MSPPPGVAITVDIEENAPSAVDNHEPRETREQQTLLINTNAQQNQDVIGSDFKIASTISSSQPTTEALLGRSPSESNKLPISLPPPLNTASVPSSFTLSPSVQSNLTPQNSLAAPPPSMLISTSHAGRILTAASRTMVASSTTTLSMANASNSSSSLVSSTSSVTSPGSMLSIAASAPQLTGGDPSAVASATPSAAVPNSRESSTQSAIPLPYSTLSQNDSLLGAGDLNGMDVITDWATDWGSAGQVSRCRGVSGLQNLGNTCYMNAGLQSLCHVQQLVDYFTKTKEDFTPKADSVISRDMITTYSELIEAASKDGDEIANNARNLAEFTDAFAHVMRKMWFVDDQFEDHKEQVDQSTSSQPSSSRSDWSVSSSLKPDVFRALLGREFKQFKSNSQADGQEFLALTLDKLHEELHHLEDQAVKTKETAIQRVNGHVADDGDDKSSAVDQGEPKSKKLKSDPQETQADQEWKRFITKNRSIITEVFSGQTRSEVTCNKCSSASVTYETFTTLPLPLLPRVLERNVLITFVPIDFPSRMESVKRYGLTIQRFDRVSKVKDKLLHLLDESEGFKISDQNDIVFADVIDGNHVSRIFDSPLHISSLISSENHQLFAYEVKKSPIDDSQYMVGTTVADYTELPDWPTTSESNVESRVIVDSTTSPRPEETTTSLDSGTMDTGIVHVTNSSVNNLLDDSGVSTVQYPSSSSPHSFFHSSQDAQVIDHDGPNTSTEANVSDSDPIFISQHNNSPAVTSPAEVQVETSPEVAIPEQTANNSYSLMDPFLGEPNITPVSAPTTSPVHPGMLEEARAMCIVCLETLPRSETRMHFTCNCVLCCKCLETCCAYCDSQNENDSDLIGMWEKENEPSSSTSLSSLPTQMNLDPHSQPSTSSGLSSSLRPNQPQALMNKLKCPTCQNIVDKDDFILISEDDGFGFSTDNNIITSSNIFATCANFGSSSNKKWRRGNYTRYVNLTILFKDTSSSKMGVSNRSPISSSTVSANSKFVCFPLILRVPHNISAPDLYEMVDSRAPFPGSEFELYFSDRTGQNCGRCDDWQTPSCSGCPVVREAPELELYPNATLCVHYLNGHVSGGEFTPLHIANHSTAEQVLEKKANSNSVENNHAPSAVKEEDPPMDTSQWNEEDPNTLSPCSNVAVDEGGWPGCEPDISTNHGDQQMTLKECLDNFSRSEALEQDWFCYGCNEWSRASKTMSISRAPQVFIVYLKRFLFVENTCYKLDDIVQFEHELKISPRSFSQAQRSSPSTSPSSCTLDSLKVKDSSSGSPEGTMIQGRGADVPPPLLKNANHSSEADMIYELQSIICHVGESSSGHYTCYARHPETKEWFYFNDSCVTRELPRTNDPRAYILFYARAPLASAS